MHLFRRPHAAFVDMREQHVADAVGYRLQLFGVQPLGRIARKEFSAGFPVEVLRDDPAVEDRAAFVSDPHRDLAQGIQRGERFGLRPGVGRRLDERKAGIGGRVRFALGRAGEQSTPACFSRSRTLCSTKRGNGPVAFYPPRTGA